MAPKENQYCVSQTSVIKGFCKYPYTWAECHQQLTLISFGSSSSTDPECHTVKARICLGHCQFTLLFLDKSCVGNANSSCFLKIVRTCTGACWLALTVKCCTISHCALGLVNFLCNHFGKYIMYILLCLYCVCVDAKFHLHICVSTAQQAFC